MSISKLYDKRTLSYLDDLVRSYAEYNTKSDQYILDTRSIDEDEMYKLCSYMLAANDDLMIEITETDNQYFEKYIQPALLSNLRNSLNAEVIKENMENINKGVFLILSDRIYTMLDERLDVYASCMEDTQDYEGDRAWM